MWLWEWAHSLRCYSDPPSGRSVHKHLPDKELGFHGFGSRLAISVEGDPSWDPPLGEFAGLRSYVLSYLCPVQNLVQVVNYCTEEANELVGLGYD
jgi:hypothetical protein